MKTELLLNPALKEKFRAVLKYLEEHPKKNINAKLILEQGNTFTIEYEKPRDLFNLGRLFEPYQTPIISSSFEKHFDNSYINKI